MIVKEILAVEVIHASKKSKPVHLDYGGGQQVHRVDYDDYEHGLEDQFHLLDTVAVELRNSKRRKKLESRERWFEGNFPHLLTNLMRKDVGMLINVKCTCTDTV
jgi:hypothetical protein